MKSPPTADPSPAVRGLGREELLRRFLAKEPGNDGLFVVGVLSTGIYCLPSCPAKLPRPENVRFFAEEGEALARGLRACRRCRPDDFYRHHDPDRELAVALVERVRSRPGDFAGVQALAEAAGVGKTKLTTLLRRTYHTTPAELLGDARIELAAARLREPRTRVLDAGLEAGFESSSAFHENFRRSMGLSPGAYRSLCLGKERVFTLHLPEGFRHTDLFAMFGRDAHGVCERVDGRRGAKALLLDGRPARVHLHFRARSVEVRLEGGGRWTRRMVREAHAAVRRMLNLRSDPAAFEARAARSRDVRRLVAGRRGLRIPLTSDLFEGLTWVIVGQQVNLAFASRCRSELIRLAGDDAGEGFRAHPAPEAVAELSVDDLKRLQFSGRKAEYLIGAARLLASGELDPARLRRASADRLEETLLAVRGLGPWSVRYLMMRSFGFEDCVPVGDAGLVAALQRFFELDERPDARRTLSLMEVFAPHRSLATFHLWKSLAPESTDEG